jgi:hypothetical protein
VLHRQEVARHHPPDPEREDPPRHEKKEPRRTEVPAEKPDQFFEAAHFEEVYSQQSTVDRLAELIAEV